VVNSDLVIDFVNTAGFDPKREDLPTAAALVEWLSGHGLDPGARATKADWEEARAVREAIRDLLSAHNEVETDVTRATAVLDAAGELPAHRKAESQAAMPATAQPLPR